MDSNKYKARKEARLRGEPVKSRYGQGAPWYTFRVPGIANPDNVTTDPVQRLERELTKFGEQSRYRDRFAAERAAERKVSDLGTPQV